MVRVVLIDEPAADSALNAVLKKVLANTGAHRVVVQRVRMLHDGLGRINGEAVYDLRSGLELAERRFPREPISGVDLIGHGAPGVLLLGGSSAGGPRATSHAVREWAQLDSDINKLPALVPFARHLRELAKFGRLTEDFEVRVLGCNTASDPGITPSPSMGLLQDGPVLIHLLSAFFDAPVSGVIGYIGPENFELGVFDPGEIHVRSCAASPRNGTISFMPDSFPPGSPTMTVDYFDLRTLRPPPGPPPGIGDSLPVPTGIRPEALLEPFQPIAMPIATNLPLVIRDTTLMFGKVQVDVVEHGKALVIKKGDRTYRTAPSPDNRDEAQELIARFIEEQTSRRPLWADPAASRALYF